ncbi:MAG: type II toxin-antitoxin system VapC family toxin [Candidatus Firestonebacteria bacterium]|nr:type II toxin-antitoxin system VapC family toxin [Candidatus Firestonebacteria bacterium]
MFVLDSYAVLCLFDKKRKIENNTIKKYLEEAEKGKIKLYISKINEGEIFYKLYKYLGEHIALGFREDLKSGIIPINIISVNDKTIEKASEIKAKYPISYADAFCIELACDMNLPIITGDPEFENIKGIAKITWTNKL